MQDRPTAPDLLSAISDFLIKEILPTLEGNDELAYKALVSWNMLGVVNREIQQEEEFVNRELARLESLLDSGFPEDKPETMAGKRELIDLLNHRLVGYIRSTKLTDPKSEVWSHVKTTLVEKLNISNPRFSVD